MNLYLYKNNSDKRVLNKSITELQSSPLQVRLLSNTSFIDPVFEVSYNSNYWDANYVYCLDTERYYYVNDVEYGANRIFLHCHVDVLMSFKEQILNKVVIASRSESKNNQWLEDDKFKAYQMPKIVHIPFKHSGGTRYFNMNNQQFVLCVVGNADPEEEEKNE